MGLRNDDLKYSRNKYPEFREALNEKRNENTSHITYHLSCFMGIMEQNYEYQS